MKRGSQILSWMVRRPPGQGLVQGLTSTRGAVTTTMARSTNGFPPGLSVEPEVRVSSDQVEGTFSSPSLPNLNSKEVTLASLPSIVEVTRLLRHGAWKNNFLDMTKVRASAHTFIAALCYKFSTDITTEENRITIGNVGNSSFETKLTLTIPSNGIHGDIFVTNIMNWVHMNRKTRKPTQLPDWFLQKYHFGTAIRKSDKVAPLRLPKYHKPTWILRSVTRDEVDKFGHTNYEHYIRFALEAVRENLVHPNNQPLDGTTLESVLQIPVRQVDVLFSGETRLGDDLQVCSWVQSFRGMDSVYSMVYTHERPIMHCTFKLASPIEARL